MNVVTQDQVGITFIFLLIIFFLSLGWYLFFDVIDDWPKKRKKKT